MEDFSELSRVFDDMGDDDTASQATSGEKITIVGTDPTSSMNERMIALTNESAETKARLDSIESMVRAMYTQFCKGPKRAALELPDPDALRNMGSSKTTNLDGSTNNNEGAESFVDVSSVGSEYSSATGMMRRKMDEQLEPFHNPFMSTGSGPSRSMNMLKSNSATAPQGYVNSASVWGTALASMMVAALRYYITKRNATMLMIDEVRVMKTYVKLASVLYETITHKGLPKVTDPCTRYISKAFTRMDKNDVPISSANSWALMQENSDGRDALAVIRTMVVAAKSVPEAMVHPISQLIPYLNPKVVATTSAGAVFTVSKNAVVNVMPDEWETWCGILKMDMLTKYVKYRHSGMTQEIVVSKMLNESKQSDLVERKNLHKLMHIVPSAINPSS